jgi:hypothetical protein
MHKFMRAVHDLQAQISKILQSIPLWKDIVHLSEIVCSPIIKFANAVLKKIPALKRVEWLFEVESLTRRHPVLLMLSLLCVALRGILPTNLGHIGTDPIIYPLMGAISGFNPFLGLISGVLFGVADLLQKLVWPDIYGARGWGDLNYWGAMAGYAVSYSSLMIMGMLPGFLSRLFRKLVRCAIQKWFFIRSTASADGAAPSDEAIYPLAEMVAGAAGGFLGGYMAMDQISPHTESPAFYWRPQPDTSCHHLEVYTHLKGRAGIGGVGSALGGLTPTLAPSPMLIDKGPYTPAPPPPKPQEPELLTGRSGAPTNPQSTTDNLQRQNRSDHGSEANA